ncbi:uncharacterized protein [Asterias amurensis]|uniref:uncharacterized protein n=1 Tax=Asterias amurensis TaxID=7602 RepID=UPI003AB90D38
MGGTHSRSEDLRKKTFMNSTHYIDSLHEVPGYFSRTQDVTDFLGEDFPSERRTEMSYTGPPSHLSLSQDVHPFLDRVGSDFQASERFVNRSQVEEDVPSSLLPSADTAEDYRDIEVRETMATLKEQVKEALAKKRDVQVETVPSGPPEESPELELPTDEKSTLDFLDSIINESMDLDIGGDSPEVESHSEANWIMRDKSKTPLPGLMHSTVPDLPMSPSQPPSRPSSGFFSNSMYLPDSDTIHSLGRSKPKPPPPPTKPKPTKRHSRHIPDEIVFRNNIDVRYVTSPPPIRPIQSVDILGAIDTMDSKNSSNASTEDMGIVLDDVTSDEGSRSGEMGNIYDTKSRVKGVRALVSMYSEEGDSPTDRLSGYDFSPNDSMVGLHYPERDYSFGNNNNSNSARFFSEKDNKTDTSTTYGTISSEDSALGDGREVVDDAVLGIIHSELEKLRIN